MGFTFLLATLLAVLTLRGRVALPASVDRILARFATTPGAKPLALLVLVASLALELQVLEARLHLPNVLPRLSSNAIADAFGLLAILQTLALLALSLALARNPRRGDVSLVIVCAAVMLALGVSFVTTSGDVTAYVANGLIPNPYDPPNVRFPGEFGRLNDLWRTPLINSPYGPLEQALSRGLDATATTLAGKIHAFQLFGALVLVAIAAALRAGGRGVALWALVACNPFLIRDYVAEAHNDLIGIALATFAGIAEVPLAIAVGLVIAAGAIKFTLALVGLVAFVRFERVRTRILAAACVLAGSALIFALEGAQYVHSIRVAIAVYAHPVGPGDAFFHDLDIAVIAIAVGAALLRGRFNPGASWSTLSLGQFPLDNYLVWSLPAALASDVAAIYLATLPYAQYESTNIIVETPFASIVRVCVLIALLACVAVVWRGYDPVAARATRARAPSRDRKT